MIERLSLRGRLREVEAIWHAHILDNKHYRTTCDALGGTFIERLHPPAPLST